MKVYFLAIPIMLAALMPAILSAQGAPGCGAENVKFNVSTDKSSRLIGKPDSGKATIVFLQDDSQFISRPRPTTRFSLDGSWVGATRSSSYFSLSVDPGEHHLCASWQGFVGVFLDVTDTAATHFTAEPGGVYFFAARNRYNKVDTTTPQVKLLPLDSDEGQLMTGKFSLVSSRPKK